MISILVNNQRLNCLPVLVFFPQHNESSPISAAHKKALHTVRTSYWIFSSSAACVSTCTVGRNGYSVADRRNLALCGNGHVSGFDRLICEVAFTAWGFCRERRLKLFWHMRRCISFPLIFLSPFVLIVLRFSFSSTSFSLFVFVPSVYAWVSNNNL